MSTCWAQAQTAAGASPQAVPAAASTQLANGGLVSASDAITWLQRVQQAAADRSYQGTVTFSVGGAVSSSRLAHFGEGNQRYERLEVLDGRAKLQYRHNDQLLTVWPANKLALLEPRDGAPSFPALSNVSGLKPLEHYALHVMGLERIAGREAEVLLLKPRDAQRFSQRWWVDRESGLLLRSDLLGAQGEVLESSAFTELRLDGKPPPDTVLAPGKRLAGLKVIQRHAQPTQLEAEGWQMSRMVPGFQLLSCGKRPLDAAADSATVSVLQTVFSDGLAHLSVFIEPFDALRHRQGMRTTLGATSTVMHRRGDWWITVVGEVPMATVLQFDAALERRR